MAQQQQQQVTGINWGVVAIYSAVALGLGAGVFLYFKLCRYYFTSYSTILYNVLNISYFLILHLYYIILIVYYLFYYTSILCLY